MLSNVLQLIAVVIVFVLVLVVTYYATKWIAKTGAIQAQSANIKVIETFKIAPNKYIQIIKLGTKYYSIGVTKENITFLAPLEEEQLDFTERGNNQQQVVVPFKDMLGKIIKKDKEK
ncbi:MAG: flagellar biosynthetic protein FliO [Lachnospiraceae bacterium]|nr:flagellar biosynthetic protein FliO [Lachnospiraceae bacterium]